MKCLEKVQLKSVPPSGDQLLAGTPLFHSMQSIVVNNLREGIARPGREVQGAAIVGLGAKFSLAVGFCDVVQLEAGHKLIGIRALDAPVVRGCIVDRVNIQRDIRRSRGKALQSLPVLAVPDLAEH